MMELVEIDPNTFKNTQIQLSIDELREIVAWCGGKIYMETYDRETGKYTISLDGVNSRGLPRVFSGHRKYINMQKKTPSNNLYEKYKAVELEDLDVNSEEYWESVCLFSHFDDAKTIIYFNKRYKGVLNKYKNELWLIFESIERKITFTELDTIIHDLGWDDYSISCSYYDYETATIKLTKG